MLAHLPSLFEDVDILFGNRRQGRRLERQLIVVRVDELRQPQRTSHPCGAATDDDDIRLHLWAVRFPELVGGK